ncbi:MAG: TIGR04255 family protein [Candidatus Omnitrophica bacterium]|nr:TIGR04255 family protein [Candidatus Omnitrophota bacterium]
MKLPDQIHKYMKPYPNPPIQEALLDIRTVVSPEIDLQVFASYQGKVKDRFPKKEDRFVWAGGFQFKPGNPPEIIAPSGGPNGFFFRSTAENKIVQARKDGFTFNKLRPYENWDVFLPEAKELWKYFVSVVKPKSVTRLALRYINRIEIPLPIKSFKDYLVTVPEIADGLPQGLAKFFMQLVVPKDTGGIVANITETMEPIDSGKNVLPFILDIDVYQSLNLEPVDRKIWEIFDGLREYKNLIFKKSVTPKCEELFQ